MTTTVQYGAFTAIYPKEADTIAEMAHELLIIAIEEWLSVADLLENNYDDIT